MSKVIRSSLQENLSEFQSGLIEMCELYKNCQQRYSATMHKSIDGIEYFETDDLLKLHNAKKVESIDQVRNKKMKRIKF